MVNLIVITSPRADKQQVGTKQPHNELRSLDWERSLFLFQVFIQKANDQFHFFSGLKLHVTVLCAVIMAIVSATRQTKSAECALLMKRIFFSVLDDFLWIF